MPNARRLQDTRPGRWLARGWAGAALGVLPAAAVACGHPGGLSPVERDPVAVRTLTDAARVGPGQTFHVAVVFNIKPKWHIYWKNPGEGAMAPRVIVEAPPGFEVGPPRWPRPVRMTSPLGPEYGHFDEVALFVPVTAPPRLDDGKVTLRTRIDWAVCKNVCRLGSAQQSVVVQTASQAQPAPSADDIDTAVRKHRKRLPRPIDQMAGGAVTFDGKLLTVSGHPGGHTDVAFFPDPSPGVTYGRHRIELRSDRFVVRVGVELDPGNALGQPMVLGGLVALGRKLDDPCYDFMVPAEEPPSR